jgi:hypothetical protein
MSKEVNDFKEDERKAAKQECTSGAANNAFREASLLALSIKVARAGGQA